MLIYLDTNLYCRPFDEQSQKRIKEESYAFAQIIEGVEKKEFELLSSQILKLEVNRISILTKRLRVQSIITLCNFGVLESEELKTLAERIQIQENVKERDALHIASSCIGRAKYFLSCDDNILKKSSQIEKFLNTIGYNINILNPITFIRQLRRR